MTHQRTGMLHQGARAVGLVVSLAWLALAAVVPASAGRATLAAAAGGGLTVPACSLAHELGGPVCSTNPLAVVALLAQDARPLGPVAQ